MSLVDRHSGNATPAATRARLSIVMAVLAGTVAVSCSTSGSSKSSAASTPPPSHRMVCQTSHLRASFTDEQGTPGHYHAIVVLTNTGTQACTIVGYPQLQMLGPANQPLATSVAQDHFHGPSRLVVLAPSRRASPALTWVEISSGEVCVQPQQVQITPPGNVQALLLAWPAEHNVVCDHGVIQAGPITAGLPLF